MKTYNNFKKLFALIAAIVSLLSCSKETIDVSKTKNDPTIPVLKGGTEVNNLFVDEDLLQKYLHAQEIADGKREIII